MLWSVDYGLWTDFHYTVPVTHYHNSMKILLNFYRWFTWLSGDVVLGAMAGMLFFAKLLRAEIGWEVYGLLGMAVWCIYTADHLLDSRKITQGSPLDRHLVHRIYGKTLRYMLGGIGMLGLIWAISLFGFGPELLIGVGLGVGILGLMLFIRKLGKNLVWTKELSTAVFYVIGISWYGWFQTESVDFRWEPIAITLIYMVLAYLNLLMLSCLDAAKDKLAGFESLGTVLSPVKLILIIRKLALALILLAFFGFILFFSFYRLYSCLLLIMALVHYLSFFNAKLTIEAVRMRMEAAFMIPLLLLFI